MKLGIIIGSVREGRLGESIGTWVAEHATKNTKAEFDVIDIRSLHLPPMEAAVPPLMSEKRYEDPQVAAFSSTIDSCDGFIFVTPEYNGSIPGTFKNAVDHLAPEWQDKPVAYVGYAFTGGQGAIKHWETVMSTLKARNVAQHVEINIGEAVVDNVFKPSAANEADLEALIDALVSAV